MAPENHSDFNPDEPNWRRRIEQCYPPGLVNGIKVFIWVGAVFLGVGVFGYGVCAVRPQSDFIQLAIGILSVTLLLGYFALLVRFGGDELLPYDFIVLGSALAVTSMLVRGFGGPPLFVDIGNASEEVRACRVQMTQTWFGDLGLVWSAFAFLVGLAQWYIEYKRREQNLIWQERLRKIEDRGVSQPIQIIDHWLDLKKEIESQDHIVDKKTKFLHNQLLKQHKDQWILVVLTQIDILAREFLWAEGLEKYRVQIMERIDILLELEKASRDKDRDDQEVCCKWKTIKALWETRDGRADSLGTDERLNAILWLWQEYDVLVREWAVALIELGLDQQVEEKKQEWKEQILKVATYRRLLRHPRLRERDEFSDVVKEPLYDFSLPGASRVEPVDDDQVLAWLGSPSNPFAVACAEWEPYLPKVYYKRPRIMQLMEGKRMGWIQGGPGSGRTSLAYYTFHLLKENQLEKKALPLYLALEAAPSQLTRFSILEQLLYVLVDTWGAILDPERESPKYFNGPTAFLDLPYEAQHVVAQLLFWRFGDLAAIYAWLASLGIDLERTKTGRSLRARLEAFPLALSGNQPPFSWMLRLASARPVGLNATHVMIEWDEPMPSLVLQEMLPLAKALQKESVYLKFIAPQPPSFCCPQGELVWNREDLNGLLDNRLDYLRNELTLTEEARTLLLDFALVQDAPPRALIQAVRLALQHHVALSPQDAMPPDIVEKQLTKADICAAIRKMESTYDWC